MMEINSHQLCNDGRIKQPQLSLAPSALFVFANHVADTVCSISMGTYKKNDITNRHRDLDVIKYPPHVNPFGFTYAGKWIDGDTTDMFYEACYTELQIHHGDRPVQGFISRYNDILQINWKKIRMYGELTSLMNNTAKSHTRSLYLDNDYLHAWAYNLTQTRGTVEEMQKLKRLHRNKCLTRKELMATALPNISACPLCLVEDVGNSRHLHTVCQHPTLVKLCILLYGVIEDKLQSIFSNADQIGHTLQSLPEQTLYTQIFRELQTCKVVPPKVLSNQEEQYKTVNTQICDITEWKKKCDINFPSGHTDSAEDPTQFPDTLTLGLTGRHIMAMDANTPIDLTINVTKRNGEQGIKCLKVTSAVDKIYLPLLPKTVHDVLREYLKITKGTNETNARDELKRNWKELKQILEIKPVVMQRAISGILDHNKRQLKLKWKKAW